ncbi:hypothetical protein ACFPME_03840 [Rhodanobacter umsongensis]|uniref:DUF4013 domain-containing protein n=1 Tax=Rhodanobacter umsongensis TaxID=633153 RepID=A0ABW0JIA5_9GAMM
MHAPLAAMQWRLLVLWVLLLLLPTAVVSLPLWRTLSGLLDHSVHAQAWATRFSPLMFGDTMAALSDSSGWLNGVGLLGLLLTLALSPFLNGMAIGSGRSGRVLGFSHLLQCGVVEYGRMFRLMLWSIVPYAVMAVLIGLAFKAVDGIDQKAVLESQVDRASHMALCASLLVFVLAQAIVESGRAAFIADGSLRSATRAFGRGFMQLLRRPFSTLFCYLLISLVGYAIALALGVGRVNTPALGVGGLLLAILLAQLMVLVLGWVRVARLYALAEVARSLPLARRSGGRPAAL